MSTEEKGAAPAPRVLKIAHVYLPALLAVAALGSAGLGVVQYEHGKISAAAFLWGIVSNVALLGLAALLCTIGRTAVPGWRWFVPAGSLVVVGLGASITSYLLG